MPVHAAGFGTARKDRVHAASQMGQLTRCFSERKTMEADCQLQNPFACSSSIELTRVQALRKAKRLSASLRRLCQNLCDLVRDNCLVATYEESLLQIERRGTWVA
jgi:hypothetical protein